MPPKPSHLGPVQKRQLRKESSLPPAAHAQPLRREASFDSVASGNGGPTQGPFIKDVHTKGGGGLAQKQGRLHEFSTKYLAKMRRGSKIWKNLQTSFMDGP